MTPLGCIADDYTGASDLANTLTRCGLRTVQAIGIPADSLTLPDVSVVVVSLKIRSIAAAEAVSQARAADAWLRKRGASHVMYKICSTFDSTDDGNIGPVLDALRTDAGEAIAVVTPAFPETARTVYQGNLFVGALPLNESPLKDHPLNPMRDANLVRVLARQSRSKVELIDLRTVVAGPAAIRNRLADLAKEGFAAAIADAVFDRDLEAIGAAALERRVSIGASGLGRGLARGLIASSATAASASTEAMGAPVGGRTACLAGSCSQATLTQIERAERAMPVLNSIPTGSSADRRKCNARLRGRANISIRDLSCLQAVPRPIESRPSRLVMAVPQPGMQLSKRWQRLPPACLTVARVGS